MNPEELWNSADALLDGLLDLTPEQRHDALTAMSLSTELRTAVERLLAAHEADGGVLDRSLLASHSATDPGALSGKQLGRWQLEQEIGRGGMAVVYRAHALDGSAQVAALKLLTLGAQANQGIEHFRLEQSVLARMRHPHIATLFESGIADDGTPWLAMALVEGVRIDRWCEQQALSPHAIVELLIDLCDAVGHAHRNLVIHRDIKPSNVLVDQHGHVRLLDFGIARLIDAQGEITATQWRALTPDYAAPEQLTGAPPSTAMDVYALGALLYRLLVGRTPRSGGDGAATAPTAPSRAMHDATAAAVVKGDLDAVLLKALAQDPMQRYESTAALAQDLKAWLQRRPISARTPSRRYRALKFIARHRVGVAATALALAALLAGLSLALWQGEQARASAQLARAEAERATAVKQFVLSLFEATDPEQPGGAVMDNRGMLRRGVERVSGREAMAADLRVEILTTIAAAQRTMAWYEDAELTLKQARTLIESTPALPALIRANALHEQACYERVRGNNESALPLFARAEAVVATEHSEPAQEFRVRMHTQWGIALRELGRSSEAVRQFERAEQVLVGLPNASADLRSTLLMSWGSSAYSAGDYPTALARLRAAYVLERRPENSGNASISLLLNHLSGASAMMGLLDDAVGYDREALAIARQAYPAHHPQVAGALSAYGDMLRQAGRYDEALSALNEARDIRTKIGPAAALAMVEFTRVRVLVAQGHYAPAVTLAESILPALEVGYGRSSTAVLQLLVQEFAALTWHDPQHLFMQRVQLAEQRLDQLDDDMRWHTVAQFLRWRIAQSHLARGDRPSAARWLARAEAAPTGTRSHVTAELVLSGLRLRLANTEANQTQPARTLMLELETALKRAQGASTEALAYAWLSVAETARLLGDKSAEQQAINAVDVLRQQRNLPAEQGAAFRAWQ